MIRLHGTSPDGKAPRVLDIRRLSESSGKLGVSVWVHSPDNDNGWQINFSRDDIVDALDFILNSERW